MDECPILDRRTVFDRLYPQNHDADLLSSEEHFHPWRAQPSENLRKPLLRIWDRYSGSQPGEDGRMMSRAPTMPLDTYTSRRDSLAKHLDYQEWTPGPYISFTTSPTAINKLAPMRVERRGSQTLTVVDPNRRMKNRLPVLEVTAEMDYYRIPNPYRKSSKFYINHYVCLWHVTKAEIVGDWEWTSLSKNKNWYHDVILPAFERFTTTPSATGNEASLATEHGTAESTDSGIVDLQNAFGKMSGKFIMLICNCKS